MTESLQLPGRVVDQTFMKHPEYPLELAHVGQGNWRAFRALGLDLQRVMEIAGGWSASLEGIDRPWLCWNVDDDWCLIQQRLVQMTGWTPLIGFDPRVGPPSRILPGSVVFDFNAHLGLPVLYPHFPLEFAFLFCDRIAFWHSDLLIREEKMRALAHRFGALADGDTAATWVSPGLRHSFSQRKKRYWELVGCTTRQASQDQFRNGCGWWMEYWAHPNQSDGAEIREKWYWDHGAGVYYWRKRHGGRCVEIPGSDYAEGHFTKIGNSQYKRVREGGWSDARRAMSTDIKTYFNLDEACARLGLVDYRRWP
ncbi:hypothetical protein [Telmatospirillum sp.]|uniref:hypothetical protein n=1 Tax=Telmatospirillum sp. TaxID=2079197 RepID=UPI002850166E|nr:hypothetical protein [Telmatospirillum sp.]MDR3439938.1 hypothetical protein [Telmatospirillum sp.]